jgi:quercetin dioxygenase-like cupin family protein
MHKLSFLLLTGIMLACAPEQARIFVPEELGNAENFTGEVRVKFLLPADTLNDISVGAVRFEAGARTHWHKHPGGQVLLITEGTAWYQERGKERVEVPSGELVRCLPEVEHWHGASQDQAMTHIAIGTQVRKGSVVWKEKVSDSEYLGDIVIE